MTSAPPADPTLQPPPPPGLSYPAAVPSEPGPAATFEPPDPPQGPGVHPPFPAPPIEGRGRRIGMGLGIGAGVTLLVCGGGVAAVIGVAVSGTSALNERARAAVNPYFAAVEAKKYDEAYGMQCPSEQRRLTQAEFVSTQAAADPIRDHQVGTLDLTAIDLAVPVTVTYTDGQTGTLQVYLDQSPDTGQFEVCGVQE